MKTPRLQSLKRARERRTRSQAMQLCRFDGLRRQYNDHDERATVNVCLYMLFEESDGQPAVPEDLEKRLTCSGCMLQLPDKVVLTRLITPQNDRKARIMRIA